MAPLLPDTNPIMEAVTRHQQEQQTYPRDHLTAWSLKQRFCDYIDQRTTRGIQTYGRPLLTYNSRDAQQDMTEKYIDFSQYQEQSRIEWRNLAYDLLALLQHMDALPLPNSPLGQRMTIMGIYDRNHPDPSPGQN